MSEKCGYTWNHWNHWNHHPIFGFSILNQPLMDFMLRPWTPDHVGAQAPTGAGALPTCSPSAAPLAGAASSHVARGSPRTPGRIASTGRTSPGDGRTRGRDSLGQNSFFWGENYIEDVLKFWDLAFFLEQKTNPCAA